MKYRKLRVSVYMDNNGDGYHVCRDIETDETFRVDIMVDGKLKGEPRDHIDKVIVCCLSPYICIANDIFEMND